MEYILSTFVTHFWTINYSKFQQVAFGLRFENHHRLLPIKGTASFGCGDSHAQIVCKAGRYLPQKT